MIVIAYPIKKVSFLNIAPYIRYVHEDLGYDDYKLPPRVIYDHEIIFVLAGECIYTIEGKQYVLRAGDIHFMKPHILHSCFVPKGKRFHYFAVHFDFIYMGEDMEFSVDDVYVNPDYLHADYIAPIDELTDRPVIEISEVDWPYVFHTYESIRYVEPFRKLVKVFNEKQYGYHIEMRSALLQIIHYMVQDLTTKEGIAKGNFHTEEITRAIHYIHSNYDKPLDLEKMVESLYLSPNYFRTLFKQATGKTITEYITYHRIDMAKKMLIQGKYSISQIGQMVGYEDIHYFSKVFKKMEGLSPKRYVESINISYAPQ